MNFRKRQNTTRRYLLALSIAFGAALASGCAGGPSPARAIRPVFLTNAKSIVLLPTQALGGTVEVRQLMEGRYGSMTYSLEAYVKAGPEEIAMVALSGFGTEVYSLTYRNSGIEFTAVPFAGNPKPEYLVADFQLCYFPAAAVSSMVGAAGLAFTETKTDDGWRREVRDGDAVVIGVSRRGATIEFENRLRGYGYTIREAGEEAP